MKSRAVLFASVLLTFVGFTQAISAQTKASEQAYLNWKGRQVITQKSELSSGHLGIGFAAAKYMGIGASVDISVFAGEDVTQLPPLEFLVQPVGKKQNERGDFEIVELGKASSIKSAGATTLTRSASGAAARPEIIIRVPADAVGVKIVVRGFGGSDRGFSVVLPLKDEPSTAVLAKSEKCSVDNLSECVWYTGSCEGGSCPSTMCAACNNASPHLNCASCTMGCSGGGPGSNCTPSAEAPVGCPQV